MNDRMGTAARSDLAENRKPSVFKRILAVLLVTALLLAAGGCGGVYIVLKGPSPHAASMLVGLTADIPVVQMALGAVLSEEEIALYRQAYAAQTSDHNSSGEEMMFSVYPQLG